MLKPLHLAILATIACSPATPPIATVQPIMIMDAAVIEANLGPSHWALAYASRWLQSTMLPLDGGGNLLVGDGGERWIDRGGVFEGATTLLPERIVGAQKIPEGFRFIGESGAVYTAREPLGVVTRVGDGVKNARQVTVGKGSIFVADSKGDLLRSGDGGKTFAKIDLPKRDGVVIDVAMRDADGLAIVAPQRFYGTKDDGLTWTPVKSPGGGVRSIMVRDNTLVVEGADENFKYDPAWGTFTVYVGPNTHVPVGQKASQKSYERHADGKRILEIIGDATDRSWSIATGEIGTTLTPHRVTELIGCDYVSGDIRGDTILLSCDGRGTVTGGIDKDGGPSPYGFKRMPPTVRANTATPDGGTLGYVTKLFRSEDSGKTFRDDATVEGGAPAVGDVPVALGVEGIVYIGQRCGFGYPVTCFPARVRTSSTSTWVDQGQDAARQIRFTRTSQGVFSLGISADDDVQLFKWKPGAATPDPIATLGRNGDPRSGTLTVDEDGAIRGFARGAGGKYSVYEWKEGKGVTWVDTPQDLRMAAFAGKRGLALGSGSRAYETADGGKSWSLVASPALLNVVDSCTSYGCITDRGYRLGWDGTSKTPPGTKPETPDTTPQYAKPLRCTAKDKWVVLGGGDLPAIEFADHGTSRWIFPARDKDNKIALLLNKRGDPVTKTTSIPLFGAPPGPPKFGAGTVAFIQPGGVVGVRYSYLRDRKNGSYNPVDASIVWYRDSNGKTFRGSVSQIRPFRVNKDPQGGYNPIGPYAFLPEIVQLSPKGVIFHPNLSEDEDAEDDNGKPIKPTPITVLRDDGKQEKIPWASSDGGDGDNGFVMQLGDQNAILAGLLDQWRAVFPSDKRKIIWGVMGGLDPSSAPVSLVDVGGKTMLAATLRDTGMVPRAWLLSLGAEPDLAVVGSLPTQKSLGDEPKACDAAALADPKLFTFRAPYVLGSRHPMIVDIDGISKTLGTGSMSVKTNSGGQGCAMTIEAVGDGPDDQEIEWSAFVFPDDLQHSVIFKAKTSDWPAQVNARLLECKYEAGPLPEDLKDSPGFSVEAGVGDLVIRGLGLR